MGRELNSRGDKGLVQIFIKVKNKKVLITGGAGYVGSALVPSMLEKGYNVTVYDLYMYGDVFSDIKNPNLIQVKGDIRDKEALIEASKGVDVIMHLACISNDPSFELDPDLGKSINLDAFYNVLAAVKENNVKRFIYASSSSVYGVKEEPNVREDTKPNPLTDYSKFKLECEKIMQETDLGGTTKTIIRPATVCGYAPRLRLDLVVNILAINALVNKKIKVYGGSQLRPNINIKDMVRAYEALLEAPHEKIHGEAFNAGYQNRTVKEIAEIVKKVIGDEGIELEVVPSDDIRSYHINSDKMKEVVGFEPEYTIEEAVQTLADAYEKGLIVDGLNNHLYYNIKKMQEVKLK